MIIFQMILTLEHDGNLTIITPINSIAQVSQPVQQPIVQQQVRQPAQRITHAPRQQGMSSGIGQRQPPKRGGLFDQITSNNGEDFQEIQHQVDPDGTPLSPVLGEDSKAVRQMLTELLARQP